MRKKRIKDEIQALRLRVISDALVQEGDKPAEDPAELILKIAGPARGQASGEGGRCADTGEQPLHPRKLPSVKEEAHLLQGWEEVTPGLESNIGSKEEKATAVLVTSLTLTG